MAASEADLSGIAANGPLLGQRQLDESAVPVRPASSGRHFPAHFAGAYFLGTAMALFFVAAASGATLLLGGLFPYPFLFLFFAAVMASAWFGGTASGLFSVLLSTVVVDFFFLPPYYSFEVNATETSYFAAFVICSLVASWVSSSKKRSEQALRETRDHLETRVAQRTGELQTSNRELLRTQAELARFSRVLTMGELTASIAHEVNQPITAVVAYGHACLGWLSAEPPNLDEARQAAERVIQDGTRAGAVLGRIRALFHKETSVERRLDMNEVIRELVVFLAEEAARHRILIRTHLDPGLPVITGDRVLLQQAVLNLAMNAIDAMRDPVLAHREITIASQRNSDREILIRVEDSGAGLAPQIAAKIFDPFFTTKPQGIGMGLSICRSIIEAHSGHLWTTSRPAGGAIFEFTVPVSSPRDDA